MKFLSDSLFNGGITVDGFSTFNNSITLTNNANLVTTNQFYVLASNYQNGIPLGYDSSGVFVGYSMGATPIYLGSNGSGNLFVKTTGNTIIENGSLLVGTTNNAGYKLDVNGSIRADSTGYYATNGTTTAPVLRFLSGNKVHLDPQGYGASTGATLDVNGQLTVNGYVTSANYHMVQGGSVSVDTPFISYGIGRPEFPHSLQPLAGMGGYYAGAGWYNGAGLTFYTSSGPDISGGAYLTEVMRITPTGVLSVTNLSGTGTRMVVANSAGVLSTQAVPGQTTINNNADYRIVTGSGTANTLNANAKLVFYDFMGAMYIEAEASYGYGAGLEFVNTAVNGTQWGFYAGSTSDTGFMLYRYTPSQVELAYWNTDRYSVRNDVKIGWSSTALSFNAMDTALVRESAGLVQVNNGTTNTYASLKALNLTATGDVSASNVTASAYVIANTFWTSGSYKNNNNGNMSLTFSGTNVQLTTDYGVAFSAAGNGDVSIPKLSGSGSRMVVADGNGLLSTQAVPSAITNYVTTDTTQTITGQKTFSALTTIFDSNQTSTFIEGKASGVLYGGISFGLFYQFNAYPGATQGYLWKNGAGSNVMALSQTGVLNLSTLAGSGTRMVVADSNGNISSQSIPTGSLQGAVDADKTDSGTLSVGTTTVKSVSASTYSGVFFDYVVKNSTNVRVGSVVAITNGSSVEYYETLSNDLGNTTGITFAVDLSAGNIRLRATTSGTGWTAIVSTRAI